MLGLLGLLGQLGQLGMMRGVAILAAGASRRLGQPKQLVTYAGVPLVRRIAALALGSAGERSAVVLGHAAPQVAVALQGLDCDLLENPAWPEGIAASVRVAASWASARGCTALMLLTCDQLQLSAEHLRQLWAAWERAPSRPVASAYAGTVGIPAIFPRAYFDALLALRGDRGAGALLRAPDALRVQWEQGAVDLDTPADLARLGKPPCGS